ncbi:MAG: GHKL domain-containing protein [Lachnospiraceae bacterium]|uniref:sensor histidine kinase n=1 Tax=Parablautia intestinalis TaxID=2320100 RepID=UPI00256F099C|nr:GHKL domain-containing protein [Parablautia intestinalis]MCI8530721.1 GHKL domain-containing protein [Lachnospiraceae bacterium]
MVQFVEMLLPFFQLSLAIRNVWPKRMSLKTFFILYMLLLLAGMPVTLLSCIPYGLFGILVAACIFGLTACRDTASQNVCMGMIGFVLTVVTDNILSNFRNMLISPALSNQPYFSFGIMLIRILLFYFITLLCGRLLKKLLLSGKGILRLPQTWYLIDAALLLLITIYLFDDLIPGQNGSVGKMIYNNVLHISGYLLVMLFLLLAMRRSWLEQVQTQAKQKSLQDLQDYTHNLEVMYNGLRSFKHDYVNILLSLSGYIENGNIDELKNYFENQIFPTKNLIDRGDYKLNQLSNIGVLEIKSLLSAKMIYAHESGIDVTIDIPDKVDSFLMDTVDLARILGIFLDNAIEATLETQQPQIGLNILQNTTGVSIIISNRFQDNGLALHKLKQKGFSTKTGHQGIGLSNVQKIISSYDNVLLETTMQCGCFTQHMELDAGKE